MNSEQTYNGWRNYATWRVNLEFFDNNFIYDYCEQHYQQCGELPTVHNVREYLETFMAEIIDQEYEKSFLVSYAHSFINQVDFHDIAETQLSGITETEFQD